MPLVSACAPFHSEIRALAEEGLSITEIHRAIKAKGYPHTSEAIRHYIKRNLGILPKRWANQYGAGMRAERRVHPYDEYIGI